MLQLAQAPDIQAAHFAHRVLHSLSARAVSVPSLGHDPRSCLHFSGAWPSGYILPAKRLNAVEQKSK